MERKPVFGNFQLFKNISKIERPFFFFLNILFGGTIMHKFANRIRILPWYLETKIFDSFKLTKLKSFDPYWSR